MNIKNECVWKNLEGCLCPEAEQQLQTAKEENERLKSKNATLKMYKYWGEILKEAQPKIDELQEYLIKNQLFDFAQKLLFTRKENIALTQQNKQMMDEISEIRNMINPDRSWESFDEWEQYIYKAVDKIDKLQQALKGGE